MKSRWPHTVAAHGASPAAGRLSTSRFTGQLSASQARRRRRFWPVEGVALPNRCTLGLRHPRGRPCHLSRTGPSHLERLVREAGQARGLVGAVGPVGAQRTGLREAAWAAAVLGDEALRTGGATGQSGRLDARGGASDSPRTARAAPGTVTPPTRLACAQSSRSRPSFKSGSLSRGRGLPLQPGVRAARALPSHPLAQPRDGAPAQPLSLPALGPGTPGHRGGHPRPSSGLGQLWQPLAARGAVSPAGSHDAPGSSPPPDVPCQGSNPHPQCTHMV